VVAGQVGVTRVSLQRFPSMEGQETGDAIFAGTRFVPGRSIPVPSTVSPSLHTTIAAPCRIPAWDANPKDAAEWKTWNDFCEYEDSLNGAIANQRLAVLCTYPLAVLRRRLLSDLPRQSGKPL
jgi:hypothetical protein